MNFYSFFDKIKIKTLSASSLEELIVRQRRSNMGNNGLPFKHERNRLVSHQYNKEKKAS